MLRIALLAALTILPHLAYAADVDIVGTYRLISSKRVIVDTGETEDTYGNNPVGYITYGPDGRMMAIIVFSNRPRPESLDRMTDQDRAELFRTMLAYGGTYKFHGNSIEHQIDISWNQLWTGTTVIRDIKKEGERLVFTTKPAQLMEK
jgi:Lipocalin-like domain